MSRLYQGTLNIKEIRQTFTYLYKRRSRVEQDAQLTQLTPHYREDEEGKKVTLDVFNSSSFAHRSLANRITNSLSPKPKPNTGFRY